MRSMFGISTVMAVLCEAALADGASGGATTAAKPKKSESEVVDMSDGRKVEFVGKRRMLKESIYATDSGLPSIRLDFRNGETRSFPVPQELLFQFAAHGAEQKLGDETAGESDLDDMILAVDQLIDRLSKRNAETGAFEGKWSTEREGGMSGTSILMKALMEYSKKTKDEIMAFLKDKTPADKAALRTSTKLKSIVDRLEAEKLSKIAKVDTDALLAGLGDPASVI